MIVIPNEVRNLSLLKTQERRDSSARSVPWFTENVLRERNDNVFVFRSLLKRYLETNRNLTLFDFPQFRIIGQATGGWDSL